MKKGLHPQTYLATYTCNSCKTTFTASSTVDGTVNVEVCSQCHPFYTGEAGHIVDTFSLVDRFNKRQEAAADASASLQARKLKKQARSKKTAEIKAGPALTLRDMLKQVQQ